MQTFPENFGDLANLSFEDVWANHPKWVEFVRKTWTDNCSGLFLEFQRFITNKLADEVNVKRHESRCREYCAGIDPEKIPRYLRSYC